ncbi:DUF4192 domain-containing protein [Micromonospora thermarum]|uniref:DUF4192 domain-containing protein n=1 Tax=Micromonospora thermarum TaxID=2720024 RepID=A0ABX0Z2I2_9ACTN|nr:DUF4192 domain-containing protein [Micromonospora thermarum]NJP30514.1 DUF4192 domain-containing protein [Micromonospora thermarum]
MTSTDVPRLSVRSPGDLIAAVPYLLGFHPADSVVVVAMHGKRVTFAARSDLPDLREPVDPARRVAEPARPVDESARHLAAVVARQVADRATVLGYGPASRVTPAVDAVRAALAAAGIPVLDALRVTDGRYWSYLCDEPECCPPDGTPYDTGSSEVTAAAVFAGQVALPDRAALAARVAPVDGPERAALRQAAERAGQRFAELLGSAPAADLLGGRAVRTAGRSALWAAQRRHRRGERLDDDEVAWLSVLLTDLTVRDHAWERTDGRDSDIALWTDVLRRAQPDLIAAPGALLAFAAWRAGHGALAAVALERVLTRHPDYSFALLLDDLLRRGVPPARLDGWPAVRLPGVVRRRARRRPDPR